MNITGQEICLPPLLKTGVETSGKKKKSLQHASLDAEANQESVSIYSYHRGGGGEEIMPRSHYPAEHEDRKGAPTFLLSPRRGLVAGLSSLLLLG